MISVEAWQAFGVVVGVLILLGGGALALQRLGIIRAKAASAPAPAEAEADISLAVEIGAVRQQSATLQESVDRQDARIRQIERKVAALDERSKSFGDAMGKIGRVHARIDSINSCVHEVRGMVEEMRATQSRIDEFLRNQSVLRT